MSAPDPTDLLHTCLRQAQARHRLFPVRQGAAPHPVIVGVSGGADSVCLLHLLVRLAPAWNLALHVAHLDHNVRPDSAADAAFVQALADAWGAPFHTRRLSRREIEETDHNLEAGLRRLRYGFFDAVAASLADSQPAPPTVAVAHTANDQAETILMHVLRGSGLNGLAGMRPVVQCPVHPGDNQTLRLVRPLLGVQRTDILHYLNDHNLTWREDPSNRDLALTRNRLRQQLMHQLAALYPNLTRALARLGVLLAAENDRAERWNREAFHRLWQDRQGPSAGPPPRVVMDRIAFRGLDLATQRGVLRCAAASVGVPQAEINFERIETLRLSIVGAGNHGPTPLAGPIVASTDPRRVSLHRQSALAFPPDSPYLDPHWRAAFGAKRVPIDGELRVEGWLLHCREIGRDALPAGWNGDDRPWQVFCDAHQVGELLLTTPHRGQTFAPLGMGGHHKNLGDFFTDRKIPVALRAGWPLIVDGASGEIVWVCGLHLAHGARIQADTERIFHLQWSKQ